MSGRQNPWRDWRAVSCAGGALLAGNAFLGLPMLRSGGRHVSETGARKQQRDCGQAGTCFGEGTRGAGRKISGSAEAKAQTNKEKDQKTAGEEQNKKESYLDAMEAAGFKNLTVDELISMKIQVSRRRT